MSSANIRIMLQNNVSEIEKLHRELESFGRACGLSSKTVSELDLILEEIVANIISYAYKDTDRHEIAVQGTLKDGELVFEVEDDGRPFNPLQNPPPDLGSPLERRKVGGLGLHLVREFTNSIEYYWNMERNRLVIRKKI